MSLAIQRSSEFSPASVGFSKLRKNKNGGKTVYLNGGDNKKLYLQLPFMRSPYGLSAFTDEGTGRTTYSLDLSFDPDPGCGYPAQEGDFRVSSNRTAHLRLLPVLHGTGSAGTASAASVRPRAPLRAGRKRI